MSLRRFEAPPLPAAGGTVVLDPAASHHLLRVTGVAPGEVVELFDGRGLVCEARLLRAEDGLAVLDAAPPTRPDTGPARWLLLAVLKGPAMDAALRMATELGVDVVVPVLAKRSVARGHREDRWSRITVSATKQCGRPAPPQVLAPVSLRDALDRLPDAMTAVIGVPGAPVGPAAATGPAAALIGPEGGWTPDEVALALARGAAPIALGPWVLRAETAAAVALSRLWAAPD